MNNSKPKFEEFLNIIEKWSSKGERLTEFGARLICPAPHIASEAYFHVLYKGLSDVDIDKLQNKLSLTIPIDLLDFLRYANGVNLFGNKLSIYGLRFSNVRTGDQAWQPFDLGLQNEKYEKPANRPSNIMLFGSCDRGESKLFFEINQEKIIVGKTPRDNFDKMQLWPDFWTCLISEAKRLSVRFDDDGKSINE